MGFLFYLVDTRILTVCLVIRSHCQCIWPFLGVCFASIGCCERVSLQIMTEQMAKCQSVWLANGFVRRLVCRKWAWSWLLA